MQIITVRTARGLRAAATGVVALLAVPAAHAGPLLLGTTSGGVGIYYNDNFPTPEAPANQAYLQAQASELNLNGAGFQFDDTDLLPAPGEQSFNSTFSGQPVGSSQFGIDLVLEQPTHDGSRTVPVLDAFDNVDSTPAGATNAGQVDWAINDYKGAAPNGPDNPATDIVNSLFRGGNGDGSAIAFSLDSLVLTGTVFTAAISGTLLTDGLIHWFGPAILGTNGDGTSNLSDLGLKDFFTFEGVLTYDSDGDDGTDRIDFYAGEVRVYAHVPAPGTLVLLAMGLAAVGGVAARKRSG